jgi:thioredoxin reductase
MYTTHTLIIGAGPFGLSLAAHLKSQGLDYLIAGRPMEFWIAHMPKGLFLRSGCDWHLDPQGIHTIEQYLEEKSLTVEQVMPLSLERYLDYTRWFIQRKQFDIHPAYVTRLNRVGSLFEAALDDGGALVAHNVVVAIGFRYFAHVPEDIVAVLPAGRHSHTCETINLAAYAGRRVLIIGGRQSAFEWAALLHECGAAHAHLSYRHDTPQFVESDWSWVSGVVDGMVNDPTVLPDGDIGVALDNGERLVVNHVITATGYEVNVRRVPFLADGNLLDRLRISKGYPCLDAGFQSSVPGLFFTSFTAGQDFGPFFGFTIGVRAAARILGARLAK